MKGSGSPLKAIHGAHVVQMFAYMFASGATAGAGGDYINGGMTIWSTIMTLHMHVNIAIVTAGTRSYAYVLFTTRMHVYIMCFCFCCRQMAQPTQHTSSVHAILYALTYSSAAIAALSTPSAETHA